MMYIWFLFHYILLNIINMFCCIIGPEFFRFRTPRVLYSQQQSWLFLQSQWKSVHALKICSNWNLHYNASYPFSLLVLFESKIFWKGIHNLTSISCILLVYHEWCAYLQFKHMCFCWYIYHIKKLCW